MSAGISTESEGAGLAGPAPAPGSALGLPVQLVGDLLPRRLKRPTQRAELRVAGRSIQASLCAGQAPNLDTKIEHCESIARARAAMPGRLIAAGAFQLPTNCLPTPCLPTSMTQIWRPLSARICAFRGTSHQTARRSIAAGAFQLPTNCLPTPCLPTSMTEIGAHYRRGFARSGARHIRPRAYVRLRRAPSNFLRTAFQLPAFQLP